LKVFEFDLEQFFESRFISPVCHDPPAFIAPELSIPHVRFLHKHGLGHSRNVGGYCGHVPSPPLQEGRLAT